NMPLTGSSWTLGIRVPSYEAKGKSSKFTWVSPRYFETLGVPLAAGRDFSDLDTAASQKVIIVSETFAKQIFGEENAIGKTVVSLAEPGYPEMVHQIVGVAKDVKYAALRERIPPVAYAPFTQHPSAGGPWLAVISRSALPSSQVTAAIERTMT